MKLIWKSLAKFSGYGLPCFRGFVMIQEISWMWISVYFIPICYCGTYSTHVAKHTRPIIKLKNSNKLSFVIEKCSCKDSLVLPHYLLKYLPCPKNVVEFRFNIFHIFFCLECPFGSWALGETLFTTYSRLNSYSSIPVLFPDLSPS